MGWKGPRIWLWVLMAILVVWCYSGRLGVCETEVLAYHRVEVVSERSETSSDRSNQGDPEQEFLAMYHRMQRAEEIAGLGHYAIDLSTQQITASLGARHIYGIYDESITLEQVQSAALPEYRQQLDDALDDLIAHQIPYEQIFRIRRPLDGRIRYVHNIAEYDPERHIVIGTALDVTEFQKTLHMAKQRRDILIAIGSVFFAASFSGAMILLRQLNYRKHIEEALRERESDLEITLQSIGDAVITTDATGSITRMNPVAQKLTGWSITAALGKPISEVFTLISTKTREPLPDLVSRVLEFREMIETDTDTSLIARDGSEYQIADSAAPIVDPHGTVKGVIIVFYDVTESYQARQALLESEQRFRQLVDLAPDAIFVQISGIFSYVNQAAIEMFGAETEDQLLETNVLNRFAPEYHASIIARGRQLTVEKESVPRAEVEMLQLDGSRLTAEVAAVPTRFRGHDGALVYVQDISERKASEQRLQEYARELELRGAELGELYRTLDQEIEKARLVYGRLVQTIISKHGNLTATAFYQPATHIGADVYSVVRKGDKLIVYLADVTGHGLDGAMFSTYVKHSVSVYIYRR